MTTIQTPPPHDLVTAVAPQLVPALTLANGDIAEAIAEAAPGRDEFIYLLCAHPRVRIEKQGDEGLVYRSRAVREREIGWEAEPWAVLDLGSATSFDLTRASSELLTDRSLGDVDLFGTIWDYLWPVEGRVPLIKRIGHMALEVRYVGRSFDSALARLDGAHHKMGDVFANTLVYFPHESVHVLTCQILFVDTARGNVPEPLGAKFPDETLRRLIIEAAEQMLIAELTPEFNTENTKEARYPRSALARTLAARGVRRTRTSVFLPSNVSLRDSRGHHHQSQVFALPPAV